jgi:hypothetical protein
MKTLEEAAKELGLREITLMNEHRKGLLPLVIIGNQKFVKEATLLEWIASKEVLKPAKRTMNEEHRNRLREAGAVRKAANEARKAELTANPA